MLRSFILSRTTSSPLLRPEGPVLSAQAVRPGNDEQKEVRPERAVQLGMLPVNGPYRAEVCAHRLSQALRPGLIEPAFQAEDRLSVRCGGGLWCVGLIVGFLLLSTSG